MTDAKNHADVAISESSQPRPRPALLKKITTGLKDISYFLELCTDEAILSDLKDAWADASTAIKQELSGPEKLLGKIRNSVRAVGWAVGKTSEILDRDVPKLSLEKSGTRQPAPPL